MQWAGSVHVTEYSSACSAPAVSFAPSGSTSSAADPQAPCDWPTTIASALPLTSV